MGTSFHVTDTSGNSISNAVISCGSCQIINSGNGFYWVSTNLAPGSGAIVVAAPGKLPVVYDWFMHIFQGGNVALPDPVKKDQKW